MKIHSLSDCQSKEIGEGTTIWQYCVILSGAVIGENCNICSHCFVENDVRIGNRVTIKNGVYVFDSTEIEDDVFMINKFVSAIERELGYRMTIVSGGNSSMLPLTIL